MVLEVTWEIENNRSLEELGKMQVYFILTQVYSKYLDFVGTKVNSTVQAEEFSDQK